MVRSRRSPLDAPVLKEASEQRSLDAPNAARGLQLENTMVQAALADQAHEMDFGFLDGIEGLEHEASEELPAWASEAGSMERSGGLEGGFEADAGIQVHDSGVGPEAEEEIKNFFEKLLPIVDEARSLLESAEKIANADPTKAHIHARTAGTKIEEVARKVEAFFQTPAMRKAAEALGIFDTIRDMATVVRKVQQEDYVGAAWLLATTLKPLIKKLGLPGRVIAVVISGIEAAIPIFKFLKGLLDD